MFLSRSEDKADTVRHEYGHTVQMKKVGVLAFIFAYAIPSILNKADNYYDEPCEITADLYGHVQKRQHSSKDIARGRIYERNAAYWGKVVSSMLKFFSPVPIPE